MNAGCTLDEVLKAWAETQPEAPFLVPLDAGAQITYREAWVHAQALAAYLKELGVDRKDRVLFATRNHWMTFPLLIACAQRRATLVPIDPDLHRNTITHIARDAAPAVVIVEEGAKLPKLSLKRQPISTAEVLEACAGLAPVEEEAQANPEDVTLMIFTSGTSGGSKAVMLTGENLLANARALARRYAVNPSDRFLCVLPTYHMNAMMITGLVPLAAGASTILSGLFGFKNAKRYWERVKAHEVTVCSLVPSIMAMLLRLFPEGIEGGLPRARFAFCGAAPLSAETWRSFEERFGLPVYQGYGLTETTCWAVSSPPDQPRRYDTVGAPLSEVCDVIIDAGRGPRGEDVVLGDAASEDLSGVGEVLIRGSVVSPGYYKNKKLTREHTSPDGYFTTGDLGFFDDEGLLHITGRLKDIIIKNGINIPAGEVDAQLSAHPSVQACKTVGVPDPLVGERIVSACVVEPAATLSPHDLKSWAQGRLSKHMWPDAVEILGALPCGATGKVAVRQLRKLISGELGEEVYASLNSWKYKRAQPSDPERIRDLVEAALRHGRPLELLAYWGCGERSEVGPYDTLALQRLRDYMHDARYVEQAAPRLTLIFTDVHARNNRIPTARMESYRAGVLEHAEALGMPMLRLSDLWAEAGLSEEQIRAELETTECEAAWSACAFKDQLIAQAGKHLEGSSDAEGAARFYFHACARESKVLAARFSDSIFISYNHPDFDFLLPPLPKVYLHSYKEGTSVKPWFQS